MHTTIIKTITPNQIEKIFDLTDLINIRLYQPKNKRKINESDFYIPIKYEIVIRHNENEKPDSLLKIALDKINLFEAKHYWKLLGDIPVNEDDDIDEDFHVIDKDITFTKGTDKIEIWNWFEEAYNISVAKDLMNLD